VALTLEELTHSASQALVSAGRASWC